MRTIICLLAFTLPFAFAACKKHNNIPVSMSAVMKGDTLFNTTDVSTSNQNGLLVTITGTHSSSDESVSLAISQFTEGKKTYPIDYRGPGGNIYGNMGTYTKGVNVYNARVGNINVTSVANNTIKGTYDLYYDTVHINGSFVAAEH